MECWSNSCFNSCYSVYEEKKSIIIDPNEIKKMFNNKSFNPNSILDLFENN